MDILLNGLIFVIIVLINHFILNRFKLNIKYELEIAELVLRGVDIITSKFEFKYHEGVSIIVRYCINAIDAIQALEDTTDVEKKRELVKEKTLKYCQDNKIDLDKGVVEIVDHLVNEFIK